MFSKLRALGLVKRDRFWGFFLFVKFAFIK